MLSSNFRSPAAKTILVHFEVNNNTLYRAKHTRKTILTEKMVHAEKTGIFLTCTLKLF